MKNIIPFSKDIKFNTKIYEITSISLENNLIVEEDNTIDGEFIISGNYKMNDISINTEPFIYNIPFNISLSDKYNNDTIKIDIDDFKYEIINEEILKVNIDVLVKGEYTQIEEEITPDVVINVNNERDEEEIDLFKEEDNSIEVNSIFDEVDTSNDKYIS